MTDRTADATTHRTRLLSAGAVMATGTVLSRLTGFVRAALILAALGKSLDADLFSQANTVPNSLYILVAGGVFNVVLVPQLVRSMRADSDGGQAYSDRVVTLGLIVLAAATLLLLLAVPLLARIAFPTTLFSPDLSAQRESAYALMRYCMPQVFFYGAFVLTGQLLNARERFGPMMWAPIVNNVVVCAVIGGYLAAYGPSDGTDGFTGGQQAVLGLGSTLGIAIQAAVLFPYLRSAGLRIRPRMDFRGVGLGHTLRLGAWTVLFVVVNQAAFFAVTRIAVSSTTDAALGEGQAAGATVYSNAYLITQVPHAILTVSLVTATMPLLSRLSAEGSLGRLRAEIISTLRLVLSVIVPVAIGLACVSRPLATVLFSHGALVGDTDVIAATIAAFTPGLVLFSVHYLVLRGFYAIEDTRTPFLVQLLLGITNVAAAVALTVAAPPGRVAMLLAVAYAVAYLVGAAVSWAALSRRLGGLADRTLLSFTGRLAAAGAAAGAAMVAAAASVSSVGLDSNQVGGAAVALVLVGGVGAGVYVVGARLLGIPEIAAMGALLRRR